MSAVISKNEKYKSNIVSLLSFFIPIAITVFAYYQQGIYPGGPNTILVYDMRGEMLPLYGYLSHFGPGYDNLLHWMSGGLGGGFIGSVAMYLSLFDIIFLSVDTIDLPFAIYFLTVFKIGLCGFFFSIFINKSFSDFRIGYVAKVVFSCSYALMSYVLVYSIILVWLDGVMLLPLLAVCVDKIITEKKSPVFVVLFSLSIINDYYISFMIAISLFLYAVYRLSGLNIKPAEWLKKLLSLLVHGILSAGISSILLFPVICDLLRGKLSENINFSSGLVIKNNMIEVLKMHLPSVYSNLGSNQPPYIFCGSLLIILAVLWLLAGRQEIKSRIVALAIVVFYYSSFCIGGMDRIWHGFRDPIGFSCRYSFTFVFFLVCFAVRGYIVFTGLNIKISKSISRISSVMIVAYTFVELSMNSSYLLSRVMEDYVYANREEYERFCDVMEYCLNRVNSESGNDYYRMIKNFNYSCMDGALFGYDGLEMFTSSYNHDLVDFLNDIGFNSSNNFIKEMGATPPALNILNIGYYMSYWYDMSDLYSPIESYRSFNIYRNEDSFPFAYFISDNSERVDRSFETNPFENINIIYDDIFGGDYNGDIFVNCDYIFIENIYGYTEVRLMPFKNGHYWIYPEFNYMYGSGLESDRMPSDLIYISCYVDGAYVGECGFYDFRYCADLGYLEEGKEYSIILDTPRETVGNIYIDFYDQTLTSELSSRVVGINPEYIGSEGIILSGVADKESDLIVTLPYEKGYQVYVNGVKTEYGAYRDALMMVHLDEGENRIEIRYLPAGLVPGCVCSLVFIFISFVYLKKRNSKNGAEQYA